MLRNGPFQELKKLYQYLYKSLNLNVWIKGKESGKSWSDIHSEINLFNILLISMSDGGKQRWRKTAYGNLVAVISTKMEHHSLLEVKFSTTTGSDKLSRKNFILTDLIDKFEHDAFPHGSSESVNMALKEYHSTAYYKKVSSKKMRYNEYLICEPNCSAKHEIVREGVRLFRSKYLDNEHIRYIRISDMMDETIDLWSSANGEGLYLAIIAEMALKLYKSLDNVLHPISSLFEEHISQTDGDMAAEFEGVMKNGRPKTGSAEVLCMDAMLKLGSSPLLLYLTRQSMMLLNWKNITHEAATLLDRTRLATSQFYGWAGSDEKFKQFVNRSLSDLTTIIGVPDVINNDKAVSKELSGAQWKTEGLITSLIVLNRMQFKKQMIGVRGMNIGGNWMKFIAAAGRRTVKLSLALFPDKAYYNGEENIAKYGYTGVVMGHEFEHVIKQSLSMYDCHKGTGRCPMNENTKALYENYRKCLIELYNETCKTFDKGNGTTVRVCDNGPRHLSENMADAVGLRVAYGMMKADAAYPLNRPIRLKNGLVLTPDQQFFVAYAKHFGRRPSAAVMEDENKEDTHAPYYMRVNGAVKSFAAFAEAFECSAKAKMNQAHRCRLFQ